MGLAFAVHNEMGRFLDERIYQEEMAHRCQENGLAAAREVTIRVSHDDFSKNYYVDLLVAEGVVYELKAVKALSGVHETQLIHYLLLLGLKHGKLINFRPPSVEARFVSTRLTSVKRRVLTVDDSCWSETSPACSHALKTLQSLLDDWSGFLAIELYREALIHFLGGEDKVVRPIDIVSNGRVVGQQKMCLLDPRTALHVSAVSKHMKTYAQHMRRLLSHTRLSALQWINFNKSTVTCTTISQ